MDSQIKDFTGLNFSASGSAARFFADHTDAEVQRKLNELAVLQTKTEATLRETVAENYASFVRANAEIRSLGGEMGDLKELIGNTLRLVQELKSCRVIDLKSMKSGTEMTPNLPTVEQIEPDPSSLRIPKWILNASDDLDRLIIEHQYTQAVVLVNRTQDYYDTVSNTAGSSSEVKGSSKLAELEKLRDVSIRVKEKGAVLAQVLKASVVRLPNSELWGASELHRQLRLLIQLGYRKAAADGFAQTQVDAIRKALRSVDVSGDPGLYTTELSRVFFLCLERACKGFVDLFANSGSLSDSAPAQPRRPSMAGGAARRESKVGEAALPIPLDVLSHLLSWLQTQVAVFASVLARQIQLGASEHADIMFERYADYYRSSNFNGRFSMHRTSSVGNRGDAMHRSSSVGNRAEGLQTRMSRADSAAGMAHRTSTVGTRQRRMSNAVSSMLKAAAIPNSPTLQHGASVGSIAAGGLGSVVGIMGDSNKLRMGVGPLTFVSECLHAVFRESMRLDVLGLEGSSSLGWTLLPEIKTLIRDFTNDIIEEIGVQVQEDNWVPYKEGRPTSKGSLWPPGVLYDPTTQSSSRSGGVSRRSVLGERGSAVGRTRASSSAPYSSPPAGNASLSPLAAAANAVADEMQLSASYVWLVAVMSEFLAEVWVLLQAGNRGSSANELSPQVSPKRASTNHPFTVPANIANEGSVSNTAESGNSGRVGRTPSTPGGNTPYYSRDDVCEIEPEVVACLLRIIVRYVRDVESTVPIVSDQQEIDNFEDSTFTEGQKECFIKTMEAVHTKLIPALNDVIWNNFFSDGSVLVQNPPKRILDRLSSKVREILVSARSTWEMHD